IDALATTVEFLPGVTPHEPIYPIAPKSAQWACISHLHPDHFVPDTLRAALAEDGQVICHQRVAERVARAGFRVSGLELETPLTLHGITVRPVLAVDGFGDDQVSWIVEGDGKRIIHCGDTLWHGNWWRIRRRYGPFDRAFLPINGVIMQFPGLLPTSGIPASMTPEQAAEAGNILKADAVCPIHYGMFNTAPAYAEYPDVQRTFKEAAQQRGLAIEWLKSGDFVNWEQRTS
ncbi:MAG: MBL fold metallo-hydrolase, partial [Ktedonobacteraceae bacterium]